MLIIVILAPIGGILSSILVYSYGGPVIILVYMGGCIVSILLTGLLFLPKQSKCERNSIQRASRIKVAPPSA